MIRWAWLLICFAATSLHAACPITHYYLGDQYLAVHERYDFWQRKEFLLGTLYPDICYLGVIAREDTHQEGVTLDDVLNESDPFLKGMLFHSFVDEKREEFLLAWKVYEYLNDVPKQKITTFVKLLEDEFLYDFVVNDEIYAILFDLAEGEWNTRLSPHTIRVWHQWILRYLMYRPTEWFHIIGKWDRLTPEWMREWGVFLPRYAEDPEMHRYIEELLQYFDELLVNYLEDLP